MTTNELNAAIASKCGWRDVKPRPHPLDEKEMVLSGYPPDAAMPYVQVVPNYVEDLNVCHGAEKMLEPKKVARYMSELWSVMCRTGTPEELERGTFHATAAQRAEALARVWGIWKD